MPFDPSCELGIVQPLPFICLCSLVGTFTHSLSPQFYKVEYNQLWPLETGPSISLSEFQDKNLSLNMPVFKKCSEREKFNKLNRGSFNLCSCPLSLINPRLIAPVCCCCCYSENLECLQMLTFSVLKTKSLQGITTWVIHKIAVFFKERSLFGIFLHEWILVN